MKTDTYSVSQLAQAAQVGLETIRYYQRRALLPVPQAASGFRKYPASLVARIRFIKHAQELGFTLDEIAALLQLEDSDDRAAIRQVASARLAQVEGKLADLKRMQSMLSALIHECAASSHAKPCPIIHALSDEGEYAVKHSTLSP